MKWPLRLLLFMGGLFLIVLANRQLITGHAVFANASYHQTTFAASGFGIGILVCLAAFLPPSDWMYKHITTGRKPRKRRD